MTTTLATDPKRSKNVTGPQLLKISPSVLYYPPPYNRIIANAITLHNLTSNYVAYKVKTTAPKRYCVRPNIGVIPPSASIEVQVHLTSFNEAEVLREKDRFQIQSVDLSSAQLPPESQDIWKTVTDAQISKQRLKVKFGQPPASKSTTQSTTATEDHPPTRHVQLKPESSAPSASTPSVPVTTIPSSKASSTTEPTDALASSTLDSKSGAALVEELQAQLRKALIEKDKLQKEVENLQSQNRRLQSAHKSPEAGYSRLFIAILSLLCALLGLYLGSRGEAK